MVPTDITVLCSTSDFQSQRCKRFKASDKHIFVVRSEDTYFAYKNNCPHNNSPLDWDNDNLLDCDEAFIQCANHGALFEINTGLCISGPCLGERLTPIAIEQHNERLYLKNL